VTQETSSLPCSAKIVRPFGKTGKDENRKRLVDSRSMPEEQQPPINAVVAAMRA
jgi:hypothetical protein